MVFRQRSTERSKRRCAKGANCASRTRVGILYTDMLIHVFPYICIRMSICICVVRNAGIVRLESETYYIYLSIDIYEYMLISLHMHVAFSQIICSAQRTKYKRIIGRNGERHSGAMAAPQDRCRFVQWEVGEVTRHQMHDPIRHTL